MNLTAALSGKKLSGNRSMDIELLRERADIIRTVRAFFDERQYLETDTPLLAPDLIPESCLEVFRTERIMPPDSRQKSRPYWLIPSPEIWMKRLIARHGQSCYQICKCFRNGESSGRFHSPEFTMLEYYTMNADYMDSLKITEDLFDFIGTKKYINSCVCAPLLKLTMEEAFAKYAGFSLYDTAACNEVMESEARRLGLDPAPGLDIPQLYDLIFIHAVEPALPKDRPVALIDYPAFVPCLAKKNADGKTTERWELYICGIELANCFTEETNPAEIKRFFESEKARKEKNALVPHDIDPDYCDLFDDSQKFSGVAMGLDRLIMVLLGRSTIDGILPFPI